MTANPATIRKGRKFDQVLEGARDIFLRDGFEGASVDDIARAAGVSKATLYSYFPDKRLLFIEVFQQECDRQTLAALDQIDMDAPVAEVLRQAAGHMVASFLCEFNQAVFRVCVAESDRFPELGAAFYRSGPRRLHDELAAFLARADGQGEVSIPDAALAADQFTELCKADLYLRHLLRIDDNFAPEEIARVIEGAVATFMARYGIGS
ncbi:TetR/AcrR family transcriptional regulator [Rhodovulum strictum]|uniref:TetR family transcriptional regulator n=1 Tax=Rhodovulum strictum TaxID=58314 RepID=A0A844BJ57_9RHOB|nr:TetR/AcrR family transcriptional regulator [Rhodovulum strictum]MRH20993.1 TetR family transcriptional regulator [Rhodovulum strictum]